jgi:hypothetical protein
VSGEAVSEKHAVKMYWEHGNQVACVLDLSPK